MTLYSLTFITITAISTFGILIETFTYSGILRSHLLFDIRILVLISMLIAVLNLIRKFPYKLPKLAVWCNKYLIMPIFGFMTIGFSIIELANFPNFVFSTFHLNYDSFFYLFVLSLSVFIYSLDKKQFSKNKDLNILILSILLLVTFSVVRTWPGGIFYVLIKEDNIFENLQFIFYFFSAILALLISFANFSKKSKLMFIYFLGLSIFMVFIAGEEIAWGQRIFGITSPKIASELNTQNEITLHNIKGLNDLQPIMYLSFSFYLATAWIFIKSFPSNIQNKFSQLVPQWNYIFYFLPIFVFYTHMNILGGDHWEWQEVCELMLAIGLFIFMFDKIRIHKILS